MSRKIYNIKTKRLMSQNEAKDFRISELEAVINKLQKSFNSISTTIGIMDKNGYREHDSYCHGFFNGLLLAANTMTGNKIKYAATPDKWLNKNEIVTDEYKALSPDPRDRTHSPNSD